MRTVSFSDERVIDQLNKDFICVWNNIRPKERFKDGLYEGNNGSRLLENIQPGDGSTNICAHVATADGKILHAVQGHAGPEQLLQELKFALEVAELPEAKLAQAYRDRCDSKDIEKYGGRKGTAVTLMKRNLKILADSPQPPLEKILKAQEAGLVIRRGKDIDD